MNFALYSYGKNRCASFRYGRGGDNWNQRFFYSILHLIGIPKFAICILHLRKTLTRSGRI
jgi:hypothetical protein